ncbi:MAG: hypothetical protein Alpg2KO_10530 [Alphaproteobacteria bacterium]
MKKPPLRQAIKHRTGASLLGYALLIGLISVFGLVAISDVGENTTSLFSTVGDQMGDVALTGSASGGGSSGASGGASAPSPQPSASPVPATLAFSTTSGSPTGLTVDGTSIQPGSYSNGSVVALLVTNTGSTISQPLAFTLDDTTHFLFASDNCTGQQLSPGVDCSLQIRARDNQNGTRNATLSVTVGNTPSQSLALSASGFDDCASAAGTTVHWIFSRGNPGNCGYTTFAAYCVISLSNDYGPNNCFTVETVQHTCTYGVDCPSSVQIDGASCNDVNVGSNSTSQNYAYWGPFDLSNSNPSFSCANTSAPLP